MSAMRYQLLGHHETPVRVRFGEVDPYGYLWHGHALAHCETARADLARRFGLAAGDMLDTGMILPMVEAVCLWKNSAYDDEALRVQCSLLRPSLPAPFLVFVYRTVRESNGQEVFRGRTRQLFMHRDGRLLTRLPDEIRQRLGTLWDYLHGCPVWGDGEELVQSLTRLGDYDVRRSD